MLCDLRSQWQVRYANSALGRLAGVSPQQLTDRPFFELFGPAPGHGSLSLADAAQRAARSGQPFTLSCVLLGAAASGSGGGDGRDGSTAGGSVAAAALEGGRPVLSVTFTAAQGPKFTADEPPIIIPLHSSAQVRRALAAAAAVAARLQCAVSWSQTPTP